MGGGQGEGERWIFIRNEYSLLSMRSLIRPQTDLDGKPVGTVTVALALCYVNQALFPFKSDFLRLAFAILLGLVLGFVISRDWHYWLMRRLGIVKSSRYRHPWDRAFEAITDLVVVHLDDGRRLRGWPEMFSDFGEDCSLFLTDAVWLDEENHEIEVVGSGMLVLPTPGSKIRFVQFVDS